MVKWMIQKWEKYIECIIINADKVANKRLDWTDDWRDGSCKMLREMDGSRDIRIYQITNVPKFGPNGEKVPENGTVTTCSGSGRGGDGSKKSLILECSKWSHLIQNCEKYLWY